LAFESLGGYLPALGTPRSPSENLLWLPTFADMPTPKQLHLPLGIPIASPAARQRLLNYYKSAHHSSSVPTSSSPRRGLHRCNTRAPIQQSSATPAPLRSNPHQAVKMSTMPATHGHSEACCNIPPIVSKDYSPKGTYVELGGMRTCETWPEKPLWFGERQC
jgi:hypothetical protein